MPKEIYEWFIQHPCVKVETYYDEIFKQLCIHMTLKHFHIKCMVEDFDVLDDVTNKMVLMLDHMHEELLKHKEAEEYTK